jgi:hypothetical protein
MVNLRGLFDYNSPWIWPASAVVAAQHRHIAFPSRDHRERVAGRIRKPTSEVTD